MVMVMVLFWLSSLASDDFMALNNSFQINTNTPLQCVPVSIKSECVDKEGQDCLTFSISTTTTIAGLVLSPSEATICVTDAEGIVLLLINIIMPKREWSLIDDIYHSCGGT